MTDTNLLHAMGNIDPRLIAEAAPDVITGKSSGRTWLKWGAMAAGLCLVAAAAWRISVAFTPSQCTDIYRNATPYEIESVYDLPAEYEGKILAQNLELSERATVDFYYIEGGSPTDTEDWYSLIVSDSQRDRELLMHCMFGEGAVDDWKVRMVLTNAATQEVTINGVEVQVARQKYSLEYEYSYYAIFGYDDVVYDLRVKSNEPDSIYEVLNQLLEV